MGVHVKGHSQIYTCVLYETKLDIKTPEHPNPYIMTGKLKVAPLARISLMQVLN